MAKKQKSPFEDIIDITSRLAMAGGGGILGMLPIPFLSVNNAYNPLGKKVHT